MQEYVVKKQKKKKRHLQKLLPDLKDKYKKFFKC